MTDFATDYFGADWLHTDDYPMPWMESFSGASDLPTDLSASSSFSLPEEREEGDFSWFMDAPSLNLYCNEESLEEEINSVSEKEWQERQYVASVTDLRPFFSPNKEREKVFVFSFHKKENMEKKKKPSPKTTGPMMRTRNQLATLGLKVHDYYPREWPTSKVSSMSKTKPIVPAMKQQRRKSPTPSKKNVNLLVVKTFQPQQRQQQVAITVFGS